MGINDIEEAIHHEIYKFQKNTLIKIKKIIVPTETYLAIKVLIEERLTSDRRFVDPQELKENQNKPILWNDIPIEANLRTKRIIIVPEGELAEALYE